VHALRYRLAGTTWDEVFARLATLGYRAAVIGPHGHGKTTFLENLAVRLEERGFRIRSVTLHDGERRLTTEHERTLLEDVDGRDCLLLDGAEQLAAGAWRRVERRSRAAGGLVITSHRAGLLPTLLECQSTPMLLAELVHDLLAEVPGDQVHPSDGELFVRHDGNVRDALRELYDLWAAGA
jgi:hypothetical protein